MQFCNRIRYQLAVVTVAASCALGLLPAALATAAEPGTTPVSAGQTLGSGQTLSAGQSVSSPSGRYTLTMQTDGNLVLRTTGRVVWDSRTPGNPGASLVMQADGNAVVYSPNSAPLFATQTVGHPGAALVLDDDDQLTVQAAGRVWWHTANSSLLAGERLIAGDSLSSADGRFRLSMQGDGNLVLSGPGGVSWSSRTPGHPGVTLSMQADGNAVIRAASRRVLFTTRTAGAVRAALSLSNAGALVVAVGSRRVWATPVARSMATQAAVDAAVAYGRSRGERVAVAVLDNSTGQQYAGGDADARYASASVMKVFIATKLLVTGQASDPATNALMWRMITLSDDDATDALYGRVGGAAVASWAGSRYHIAGITDSPLPSYWGLTGITARAMTLFYSAIRHDPVVGPWLMNAMAHMQPVSADGWPQVWGIPASTTGWQVKQGWMCCLDNLTRMASTGLVNGARYSVAVLTEGSVSVYGEFGRQTVTGMAQRLMPHGVIPR